MRWYAGCMRSEEGIERHRESNRKRSRAYASERNSRRIRMRAGGEQFYLGHAPTAEDAQQLRCKIREEAPRCP